MLTRITPGLPSAVAVQVSGNTLQARTQSLEQQLASLATEHNRLLDAVRSAFEDLNREGALQVSDATIDGTKVGVSDPDSGAFTTLSASGNVTLGDASTDTLNVGNGGIIKDASGNVGIRVTPGAWASDSPALQIGARAAFHDVQGVSTHVSDNARWDGSNWKYIATAAATNVSQAAGVTIWRTAGSGTAGSNITWADRMTLDASGNVGIGVTPSGTAKLELPASTTGVSSFRIPHGAAPTSPVNGDMWTTTAGLFIRINGATVGPLA